MYNLDLECEPVVLLLWMEMLSKTLSRTLCPGTSHRGPRLDLQSRARMSKYQDQGSHNESHQCTGNQGKLN